MAYSKSLHNNYFGSYNGVNDKPIIVVDRY